MNFISTSRAVRIQTIDLEGIWKFFLVKRVLSRGPEWRESIKAELCPLIIIILFSYIILYYYYIIKIGEPFELKPETELFANYYNYINSMHNKNIFRDLLSHFIRYKI